MKRPDPVTITPVGVMHNELESRDVTPRNFDISSETGTLEIFPEYAEALDGIKAGQVIIVLFWLHKARRDILKVYPRGDRSRGLHGVFATRSPVRPNPVALSELKVLEVIDNRVKVSGVDVLNNTPVIDLKKKI